MSHHHVYLHGYSNLSAYHICVSKVLVLILIT